MVKYTKIYSKTIGGKHMKSKKLDYSIKEVAEQSKNKTALIGICIMNMILALAYLVEVLKDTRSIVSYCIVAALCIVPSIAGLIIYHINKTVYSICWSTIRCVKRTYSVKCTINYTV